MFISYVIYLLTKNKIVKTEIHNFTKLKNTDSWKQKKVFFQLFHFRNFSYFLYALFQKMINVLLEHSFKHICSRTIKSIINREPIYHFNSVIPKWALLSSSIIICFEEFVTQFCIFSWGWDTMLSIHYRNETV